MERGAAKRTATPPPEPEPEQVTERLIVSTQPWMARQVSGKRGGTVYPSPAVVERHWSDGTVDYACSEFGCGYTAPNPRSVAAHHGYHNRGKAWTPPTQTAIDPTYTEPMTHRGYSPTDRMVALVAEQVRLALAAGMNPDAMAAAILAWFHDRPDLPDPGPAEPLTDAQVLDRIRRLVSAPTAEALAQAQADLAEAQATVTRLVDVQQEMTDAIDRMRAERDRLAEERQALRDLLS